MVAAITGSIAWAFYLDQYEGTHDALISQANAYLPQEFIYTILSFGEKENSVFYRLDLHKWIWIKDDGLINIWNGEGPIFQEFRDFKDFFLTLNALCNVATKIRGGTKHAHQILV